MVFFLIFDILCLLASLGMSVMVALVIAYWGSVNDALGSCTTIGKIWSYGKDRCTCTIKNYGFTTERWEMCESIFFEIYPDPI